MRVLVTGGFGFLGLHVLAELKARDFADLMVPAKSAFDLRDQRDVKAMFEWANPDVVIHLACTNGGGGISYAERFPASIMYDTLMMNTLVVHEAFRRDAYFIGAGSVCALPGYRHIRMNEGALWEGTPHESHRGYGIAKGAMAELVAASIKEHGSGGSVLMLANMYGRWDKGGHVIPTVIKKFQQARASGAKSIDCLGTGAATRTFLHVTDAARGVVDALKRRVNGTIILAGSQEVQIREVVAMVRHAMDMEAVGINWTGASEGQQRRAYDIDEASVRLAWGPQVTLADGIRDTVEWFEGRP